MRAEVAADDPAALGVDGGDPGALGVGDPDPAAAVGQRPRVAADVDFLRDRAAFVVDPQQFAQRDPMFQPGTPSTVAAVGDGILYFAIGWTASGLGGNLAGLVMTLGADASPADSRTQFLGGWRLMADVGNAALYLCSPLGSMVTGTTLYVLGMLASALGLGGVAGL